MARLQRSNVRHAATQQHLADLCLLWAAGFKVELTEADSTEAEATEAEEEEVAEVKPRRGRGRGTATGRGRGKAGSRKTAERAAPGSSPPGSEEEKPAAHQKRQVSRVAA